jgi:hypothetical protein
MWRYLQTYSSKTSNIPAPLRLKGGASVSFSGNSFHRFEHDEPVRQQYQAYKNTLKYKPIYYNSTKTNELQALNQRVLKETPIPDQLLDFFVLFVKQNLFTFLPKKKLRSDSFETYLKNSNAAPGVKTALRRAHNELQLDGVDEDSSLSNSLCYKWTTRSSFVKTENQLLQSPLGMTQKAPRLIQGARPEYVSLVGPFFSRFQRYMKSMWNDEFFIHFTSGASNLGMGNFINKDSEWKIFENDISAYDSCISPKLCKLEVWVAKQFGATRAVLDLMTANINTHGFTTNGWKYKVPGTRKSGDPFTSCFNSLLNAMMHIFTFHLQTGYPVDEICQHMRMLVMGDDNLMRHDGNRVAFSQDFLSLGFVTECTYRENIYEAEFCSSFPVSCKQGMCFIPMPGKIIAKFGYFISPPINTDPKCLLAGVAQGLKHLRFVKYYDKFLDGVLDACGGVKPYEFNKNSKKKKDMYRFLDPEFRYNFVEVEPCEMTDYEVMFRYQVDCSIRDDAYAAARSGEMSHSFSQLYMDRETLGPKLVYVGL